MLGPCCGMWALHCGSCAQLPQGMWDLSSPTRDRTHISCIGRQIPNPGPPGKFSEFLFNWEAFHQLFCILYWWKVKGGHKPIGQGQVSLWNKEKEEFLKHCFWRSYQDEIFLWSGGMWALSSKRCCLTSSSCSAWPKLGVSASLTPPSSLPWSSNHLFPGWVIIFRSASWPFCWFSRLDGMAVIKVTLNRVELLQRTVCP